MENEFVTYEQALALKQLGFDEKCIAYFNESDILLKKNIEMQDLHSIHTLAPIKQQVFRWFREKYDLFGCIDLHISTPINWYVRIDIIKINDFIYHSKDDHKYFKTYEEAENACIDKLIEIAKQ